MTHLPHSPDQLCNRLNAQWRNRPADERFLDLDSLHDHCVERADRTRVAIASPAGIRALALANIPDADLPEIGRPLDQVDKECSLLLETEDGVLDTTHWSFGQTARAAGTPATYLRKIDPRLAARLIDYGLEYLSERKDHALLTEAVPGLGAVRRLRALTSPTYGRIYDHTVVDMVRASVDTDVWRPPCHDESGPAGSQQSTTLFSSDRDLHLFLVDDRNPIEIPLPDGRREALCRGIVVVNSEVGYKRFEVLTFFYRYTCKNRLLWTPRHVKKLGITHSSGAPERFRREAAPLLRRFAEASVDEVRERVARAARLEVGRDKETVTAWLRGRGWTSKEAGRVYDTSMQEEGRARTVWDLVQGGTAMARGLEHTDARLVQERRYGNLLDAATR